MKPELEGEEGRQDGKMNYEQYRAVVVAEIVKATSWPVDEASNVAGDVSEAFGEGCDPRDAAADILMDAAA